jgi:hypothetical protein
MDHHSLADRLTRLGGQPRAQLSLDADGSPSLKFMEKDGKVIFEVPK